MKIFGVQRNRYKTKGQHLRGAIGLYGIREMFLASIEYKAYKSILAMPRKYLEWRNNKLATTLYSDAPKVKWFRMK